MQLFQRFCRPQSYSCCSVQACFLHTHAKLSSRRLDWLLHQIEDLINPKYARSEHNKLSGRQDNVLARRRLVAAISKAKAQPAYRSCNNMAASPDSAGCCSSCRLPRHSPKRLSEVLQPHVHSPHVPRRSCCVILKNTTGACKHHPKLVFTNTTRQTVENVFR